MEDTQAVAERLHKALFEKKNQDETFCDVIINNDLEHRLLIAKNMENFTKVLCMKTLNKNYQETSKNFAVIVS